MPKGAALQFVFDEGVVHGFGKQHQLGVSKTVSGKQRKQCKTKLIIDE
jgi:hypothetical protein